MALPEFSKDDLQGFQVLKLHYSADPDKFTDEYVKKLKAETPSEDWEREMELKPIGHVGNYPVYGDWKKNLHESADLKYNIGVGDRLIVRGWDFGKVHPCVVFIQVVDQFKNIIGEVYGTQILLDTFTQQVIEYSKNNFPGARFIDWVDATGKNERDNGLPSVAILRQHGLKPKWRMQEVEEGVQNIKKQLVIFHDGRPLIMANPQKAPRWCAAVRGGYQRNKKGIIIKDGDHDHPADAGRYGLNGIITSGARDKTDFYNKIKNYKYKPQNQWTGR